MSPWAAEQTDETHQQRESAWWYSQSCEQRRAQKGWHSSGNQSAWAPSQRPPAERCAEGPNAAQATDG